MSRRLVILVVLAAGAMAASACSRSGDAEPPRPDLDSLDPMVAALIVDAADRVRNRPDDAPSWAHLGMVYHAHGRQDLAATCYEESLGLDDSQAKVWYHLARVRVWFGDTEGAIAAIDRALMLAPHHAPAHWRRGLWLLDVGRLDEAESAFGSALGRDQQDPGGAVGLVRVAMRKRQYDVAAERLEDLVTRHPGVPYLHQLLGTTYQHLGRVEEARRELARATGEPPRWPDAWSAEVERLRTGYRAILERAQDLITAGRAAEAVAALETLRRDRPRDVLLLNGLAEAHYAMGNVQAGIDVLATAVRADPDAVATALNLSVGHERLGNAAAALRHARSATELNPSLGAAHVQLGRLQHAAGNPAEAAGSLETALRCGVDAADVQIMLGWLYIVLGRWDDARGRFHRLIRQDPSHATAWVGLARAEGELHEPARALAALLRAQTIDPREPRIPQAVARLRELDRER